jgi:3-oxoadipate enol-lactonase
MPKVKVNDIEMYYEQNGSGPDLVLISGLSVDHSIWNVEAFSDRFRVLTFDNRGVGESDAPEIPCTMETFAADTVGLCRALGIQKAHFVGHSMGGHIAQWIGINYPHMAEKLVIACSEPELSIVAYLATCSFLKLAHYGVPREVIRETLLPLLLTRAFLEDRERLEAYRSAQPARQTPKGYALQVEALRTHNTQAHLSKIKTPTLIIGCEEDQLTPLKASVYLKEQITGAELKVIQQCGHLPFVEKPAELVKLIREFLMR